MWAVVIEKYFSLPRNTMSRVVTLTSPTLLDATHSYIASSLGVRKGCILRTEPDPSSNSITCGRKAKLSQVLLILPIAVKNTK